MADRLVEFATKSLVHYIETNVSVDNAYIVTPDFNWDRKPDPLDPGNKTVDRGLPYAAVQLIEDREVPFTVSGNILYEANITVEISVCASTYTQCVRHTSDIKQALRTATSDTSGVGITLYDFNTVEGEFYAAAGTIQLDIQGSDFPAPEGQKQEGNYKYRSLTVVTLTAFRDATATLLEDKNRISINEVITVAEGGGGVGEGGDDGGQDGGGTDGPDGGGDTEEVVPLLLDTYSGAAGAYSVRKLRTEWTGSCIRVREDIGETEADIGFDTDGNLDTQAIADHCGDADGYIVSWYDQSGNDRHLTQSTASQQPKIYEGSTATVTTVDNDPSIFFDQDINAVLINSSFTYSTTISFSIVYKANLASESYKYLFNNGPSNGVRFQILTTGEPNLYTSGDGRTSTYKAFDDETSLVFGALVNSNTSSNVWINGENFISSTSQVIVPSTGTLNVGNYNASGNYALRGHIQEFIIWDTDQTSNRQGIEDNVINRYEINFGLLDKDAVNAEAAISVRRLKRSYTGFCMQIREAAGDTLQNIGFDVYGNLDVAAIKAHCGSSVGYVVRWYDQSGNGRHAIQETPSQQPAIYNGSDVFAANQRPAVDFNLVSSSMLELVSNPLSGVTGATVFTVYTRNTGNNLGVWTLNRGTNITGEQSSLYPNSSLYSFSGRSSYDISNHRGLSYFDGGYWWRQSMVGVFYPEGGYLSEIKKSSNTELAVASGVNSGLPTYSDPLYVTTQSFASLGTTVLGTNWGNGYFSGRMHEFVVYSVDKINSRVELEANIDYYYKSSNQGFVNLFATYGQDVIPAAYSVSRVNNHYKGFCLRVRESSGNTEKDIGFDSRGILDVDAISLFCDQSTGYVVKWYDQSGNGRHATQSTQAEQPIIYENGAVIRDRNNYRYGLKWEDGQNQSLSASFGRTVPQPIVSLCITSGAPTNDEEQYVFDSAGATNRLYMRRSSNNRYAMYGGNQLEDPSTFTNNPIDYSRVWAMIFDGSSSYFARDRSQRAVGDIGSNSMDSVVIGNYGQSPSSTYNWDGYVHMLVFMRDVEDLLYAYRDTMQVILQNNTYNPMI